MGIADDPIDVRGRGRRTLAALHGKRETGLQKALHFEVGLAPPVAARHRRP